VVADFMISLIVCATRTLIIRDMFLVRAVGDSDSPGRTSPGEATPVTTHDVFYSVCGLPLGSHSTDSNGVRARNGVALRIISATNFY